MDVLTFPENLLTTSGLLILMHDVLSLPDATPCDNKIKVQKIRKNYKRFTTKIVLFGPRHQKTCLQGFANNTGAYQPAHRRSLTSIFVNHVLESTMSKPATSEISFF